MKDIRFGIVGCGKIFGRHVESINELDGASVAGVCDILEDRARLAGEKYGVPWFTDHKDLLKIKDIDVISVCTPHDSHVPIGIDAARAGKHALVEKPLGLRVADVDRMVGEFKARNKVVFPVLQVRFNPPLRFLKEALEGGRLGRIYSAALVVRWARPQEYYDEEEWRGRIESERGALLSQAIHYIDILQWYLGAPESVYAKSDMVGHKNIEIEDLLMSVLKFRNGSYATVEFTTCAYPGNLECSIALMGEKGSVKIGGQAVNRIEHWEVKDLPWPVLPPGLSPNVYANGLYQGSCPNHIFIYRELLKHLDGRNSDFISADDARRSLAIIEAMYESSEARKEIFLN